MTFIVIVQEVEAQLSTLGEEVTHELYKQRVDNLNLAKLMQLVNRKPTQKKAKKTASTDGDKR